MPFLKPVPPTLEPLAADECYIFAPAQPTPAAAAATPAAGIARPANAPKPAEAPVAQPAGEDLAASPARPVPVSQLLLAIYGLVAAVFLARWIVGHIALWRLLRTSRPAGKPLKRVFDELASQWRVLPELRIAKNLRSPVCCGLGRQVVLLPQRLAESGDERSLRLVFAHELAHLESGDSWTGCWFGLAQRLLFPDAVVLVAAAACLSLPGVRGRCRGDKGLRLLPDYADFLVNLSRSTRPTRHSAMAAGVMGNSSDLFRRVTMLLKSNRRVDGVCPRRWSLTAAGAFMSLAVLLSGVGLTRAVIASPAHEPQNDVQKTGDEVQPKPQQKAAERDEAAQPPKNQEEFQQQMQKMMQEMQKRLMSQNSEFQKMMQEMQKQMQQHGFGGGGAMVFPPNVPQPGLFAPGNFGFGRLASTHGRLGAMIAKPSTTLIEQLDLPKDQGIVLTSIQPDSAAAKAGLKASDILLELNGKPVSSNPQEFVKQIGEIKADKAVDAVVLRKGQRQTVKGLKLPEAKANDFGNFGGFGLKGLNMQLRPLPVPPIPQVEGIPAVPGIPAIPNVQFGGDGNKSVSISINNDHFTINSVDNNLKIALTGTIADGKTVLDSATINDDGKQIKAKSLDKVPEKYRDQVKKLLGSIKGTK